MRSARPGVAATNRTVSPRLARAPDVLDPVADAPAELDGGLAAEGACGPASSIPSSSIWRSQLAQRRHVVERHEELLRLRHRGAAGRCVAPAAGQLLQRLLGACADLVGLADEHQRPGDEVEEGGGAIALEDRLTAQGSGLRGLWRAVPGFSPAILRLQLSLVVLRSSVTGIVVVGRVFRSPAMSGRRRP